MIADKPVAHRLVRSHRARRRRRPPHDPVVGKWRRLKRECEANSEGHQRDREEQELGEQQRAVGQFKYADERGIGEVSGEECGTVIEAVDPLDKEDRELLGTVRDAVDGDLHHDEQVHHKRKGQVGSQCEQEDIAKPATWDWV